MSATTNFAGRLFFIAVALILGVITFAASFYSSKYVFYALLFAAGIAYCVYEIWRSYSTKMKKKASVEAWAEEVIQFKKHTLFVHEPAIVYQRDREVFTYPLDGIHIHHAPQYVQILASDGTELLIPKNAFTEEQYDHFVQQANTIQAQLLS
ncbi:MAG: hypothetical protein K0R51_835 [Cytophagaceae bacterium]|nr:hypothetical protein [Cytophagaceae bacterium]